MTTILATGGAGVLGRLLTPKLLQAGFQVRVMSRRPAPANKEPALEWAQADLQTGTGRPAAVAGVDAIIHAASSPMEHTHAIDVVGTERLLEEAQAAGVAYMLYVSIVGIDRIPLGYYSLAL